MSKINEGLPKVRANSNVSSKEIIKSKNSKKSINDQKKKTSGKGGKLSNSPKEKMIKLRYHGIETRVPFEEFMTVKNMDKQKLQATKDSMIQIMKRKKEFYKNQDDVYDMEILNKIAEDRENELRNAVVDLQKEIRRDRQRSNKELEFLYTNVLCEAKNICDKVSDEIDKRKSDLMDRIMLSIANCDYKQAQLLDAKLKEQEDLFRHLHMFTYEMQQVRDNFDSALKKISVLTESNFNLKKKIFQEKLKFKHISSLMKEYKSRIKTMSDRINKYNQTTNQLLTEEEQLIAETNPNQTKKNKINKLKIDEIHTLNSINRPFSSTGPFLRTTSNINSYRNTNYTINNTNPNNFFEYKNTKSDEEEKVKDFNKHISNYASNNNLIDVNNACIRDNIIYEIDNYNPFKQNSINVLKKNIKIWNNRIKKVQMKIKESIPDNVLYQSLTDIVEGLRKDKCNKMVGGINNNLVKTNMRALPVQNKQFRKIFVDILFRNKNILEAIKIGQKKDVEKYFNKNIFGAIKKNKEKEKDNFKK